MPQSSSRPKVFSFETLLPSKQKSVCVIVEANPKKPLCLENVKGHSMMEHFRTVVAQAHPGAFFSMPKSEELQSKLVPLLGNNFQGPAAEHQHPSAVAFDDGYVGFTDEFEQPPQGPLCERIFFRVVKKSPSKQKVLRMPANVARRSTPDDMVVSVHDVYPLIEDTFSVASQPTGLLRAHVLSELTFTNADIKRHMLRWECDGCVQYVLGNLVATASGETEVSKIVQAQALRLWPGGT